MQLSHRMGFLWNHWPATQPLKRFIHKLTLTVQACLWLHFYPVTAGCIYFSEKDFSWSLAHNTTTILLSHFSRVQLCVTPEMAAHQAPPGSTIPGILQARALEWVAIALLHHLLWRKPAAMSSGNPAQGPMWVNLDAYLLRPTNNHRDRSCPEALAALAQSLTETSRETLAKAIQHSHFRIPDP